MKIYLGAVEKGLRGKKEGIKAKDVKIKERQ